jgi:hypothetical protein
MDELANYPWFKFFPTDWRSDPRLRMCSLEARGLWIEMICLMHEANPRGHLLINGIAPTEAQLGVLVGSLPVKDLLDELERIGVFSRTIEGVIYSRKMTRDDAKSETARVNGSLGGNPALNPEVKPPDKPQKLEAIPQSLDKKSIRPKRKRVSYPPEFEKFWEGYPTDANMSKLQAFNEWVLLSEEDRGSATASLEAFRYYCKRQPDYRPVHANRYLKHRRFDGHLKAVSEVREKIRPSYKLQRDTPPFIAWNAYRKSKGQPEIYKTEWFFPTEWPPGHPNYQPATFMRQEKSQ